MNTLTLHQQFSLDFTSFPNTFFDVYMPRANGEFVKIYLYLVRCLSHRDKTVSVAALADIFNHTEADVMRALRYWNNEGLIEFVYSNDGRELTGLSLIYPTEPVQMDFRGSHGSSGSPSSGGNQNLCGNPNSNSGSMQSSGGKNASADNGNPPSADCYADYTVSGRQAAAPAPAKTNFTAAQIRQLGQQDEIAEMFYLAERYLNRLLNPKDREVLLYLYVDLQFTVDLVIHLIEYCVTNNHASIRYIEKVALDWHRSGVKTIKDAKEHTRNYSSGVISVMKAFGISGRSLGQSEKDYIDKWNADYCFDDDMIIEACNRTIQNIHEPSFKYADSILKGWREKNISTLKDLENLDREFSSAKAAAKEAAATKAAAKNASKKSASYIQRDYDFKELEQMLIDNNN